MRTDAELRSKLDELRAIGYETEVVEFKEARTQYDFEKLGKYFSALCNEANLKGKKSAWLVFGIRDKDKGIVGTQFRIDPASLNSLKAEVANHSTGRLSFIEIYEVHTPEGRVLMLEIPAAPKGMPIAWKGHYYGRDGEESNALNLEELERIRYQATGVDWSASIVTEATISDLSHEAILKARTSYKKKNSHLISEIDQWEDITFLNKAKVTIRGQITRAAILLLGKSESEHFINPATAKISWILRDRDNMDRDYEHFSCPLIIDTEKVYQKIRNLKYRYIADGTIFPEEVDQYDPYIIREALNNCIAHQDYNLAGKINVVEHEDGKLVFVNAGSFIPRSVEEVVISNAPESTYRNPFLVEAMINLNMIDAIGSGIRRMFNIQRRKFFPLPDYEFDHDRVKLTVTGKVLDINYAHKLATMPDLGLEDIIALDKVAKHKILNDLEIERLKEKNLIEGRRPNFHISASVAKVTGEKSDYIKLKGFKDHHYKNLILQFLGRFGSASKEDIDNLIYDQLPGILTEKQKRNKIRNLLHAMSKKDETIRNTGTNRYPRWVLSNAAN